MAIFIMYFSNKMNIFWVSRNLVGIIFYTRKVLLTSMGHRTKRILRIERKEYQTY